MRNKSNIKTRLTVSVFLAAIGCATASGQVIFEDDFESYTYLYDYIDLVAAGYTVVNGSFYPDAAWRLWNTSGDFLGPEDPAIAGMTGNYVITDSDLAGAIDVDEELITPPIDCTGHSDVRLDFSKNYRVYPEDTWNAQIAEVDVRSSDDGVTLGSWVNLVHYDRTTVAEYDTDPEHVDISQYADGKIIQIRFHYYAADFDYWFAIDNIRVYAGGLVAHWALDDPSDVGRDDSGNGNDGTATGTAWTPAGKIDGALEFDGLDDYVDCGNSASLNITHEITVAAWVNIDAVPADWTTVIAKGDSAWRLSTYESETRFHFAVTGPPDYFAVNGATQLGLNEWHHICGTYDGTEIRLYVDGQLDAQVAYTGGITANAYPVYIGDNSETAGRFWDGLLDDIRIYDCALSQSEIQDLMPGPPPALRDRPNRC